MRESRSESPAFRTQALAASLLLVFAPSCLSHSCHRGQLKCGCAKRNCEFHVAIPDVEHCIRRIALAKDSLLISILPRSFLLADFPQKIPGSQAKSVFVSTKSD